MSWLPLAYAGTGLPAGAFFYLTANSGSRRELVVWLAAFPVAAAALFDLLPIAANLLIFAPRVGARLYNGDLPLLALGGLFVELALLDPSYAPLRSGKASAGRRGDSRARAAVGRLAARPSGARFRATPARPVLFSGAPAGWS